MADSIDISEDNLLELSPILINTLLKDHTTSRADCQRNIFWATNDYGHLGPGFEYHSPILPELITGKYGMVIQPRVLKSRQAQKERSREKAEVFTPSWICNAQNNLIDNAWFGRKDVFNCESEDHNWTPNPDKIEFLADKTWRDYVRDTRLEITCGEAPYIASRYDTTTGALIPIERRIGLLDRKLRIVGENTDTSGEWLKWAQVAFQNVYGYEWQGDNLLLARENLLATFSDYYRAKFGAEPLLKSLMYIAYIVSWNFWQMDGLKGVVPDSCGEKIIEETDLFGNIKTRREICQGCAKDAMTMHNGIYCLIRDWGAKDPKKKKIRYIDLINS